MQGITDVDDKHEKRVINNNNNNDKNVGEYHDLYLQSDALLLTDVFENFRNKCIEIYERHPAHFLSSSGLAWQDCVRKTGINLYLILIYY